MSPEALKRSRHYLKQLGEAQAERIEHLEQELAEVRAELARQQAANLSLLGLLGKAAAAREWTPLTAPGQIAEGDRVRFELSGKPIEARAALVLEPGTDQEEVIYNRKRNHYFVTSMAVDGSSSHKGVMFQRQTTTQQENSHE